MFAWRDQFVSFNGSGTPGTTFGNSMFFPNTPGQFLSKSGTTDLVNWKTATGFTVEYWGYFSNLLSGINPGPGNQDGAGTNYWSFGPVSGGELEFYYFSGAQQYITTNPGVIGLNTWYNVTAVFTSVGSNTTVSFYINGVRQPIRINRSGGYTDTVTVSDGTVSAGTPFGLGGYNVNRFSGWVDNLRVSNINRYSGASYTLATGPFTTDANTQIIIEPTGAAGSTTIPYVGAVSGNMTNASNLVTISAARFNHT